MKCGFCGNTFTEEDAGKACQGCPLHGCNLLRCPRCGYEMPPEPGLLRWLKKWFVKTQPLRETVARIPATLNAEASAASPAVDLTHLKIGESGWICQLQANGDQTRMRDLIALGVLPGMRVRLRRKFPAIVFTVGESEFAVDEETARVVFVQPVRT
jgi:Fe2+ transport system protein FeoA